MYTITKSPLIDGKETPDTYQVELASGLALRTLSRTSFYLGPEFMVSSNRSQQYKVARLRDFFRIQTLDEPQLGISDQLRVSLKNNRYVVTREVIVGDTIQHLKYHVAGLSTKLFYEVKVSNPHDKEVLRSAFGSDMEIVSGAWVALGAALLAHDLLSDVKNSEEGEWEFVDDEDWEIV